MFRGPVLGEPLLSSLRNKFGMLGWTHFRVRPWGELWMMELKRQERTTTSCVLVEKSVLSSGEEELEDFVRSVDIPYKPMTLPTVKTINGT